MENFPYTVLNSDSRLFLITLIISTYKYNESRALYQIGAIFVQIYTTKKNTSLEYYIFWQLKRSKKVIKIRVYSAPHNRVAVINRGQAGVVDTHSNGRTEALPVSTPWLSASKH